MRKKESTGKQENKAKDFKSRKEKDNSCKKEYVIKRCNNPKD
jgi:hypothetical protein